VRRLSDVPRIPPLARDAHKGDRGRALIVAGSLGMSGAARLAGWGALRGGAGLLTIAVPEEVHPVVAEELPCAMTLALPSKRGVVAATAGTIARTAADAADAIGVGPGLTPDCVAFLRRLLKGLERPMVLDADALNALAAEPALLAETPGPRVLTPHPGEAARLLGREIPKAAQGRIDAAAELADRFQAVVVLKGAGTVVCDGDRYFVCATGNPGMATGGAGDVLTGLVTARLAEGTAVFTAAVQAVHVHARAGDLAAVTQGERSVIATDIVANLGAAMTELAPPPRRAGGSSREEKGGGSRRRSGRAR
jgi:NAD(P)H-hydrate epimerase